MIGFQRSIHGNRNQRQCRPWRQNSMIAVHSTTEKRVPLLHGMLFRSNARRRDFDNMRAHMNTRINGKVREYRLKIENTKHRKYAEITGLRQNFNGSIYVDNSSKGTLRSGLVSATSNA